MKERMAASFFIKKHIKHVKLSVDAHMNITTFTRLFKNVVDFFLSRTFPGLEMKKFQIPGLLQVFHERRTQHSGGWSTWGELT